MPVSVPIAEFQLGHGGAKLLKSEKVAAMKREGKPGATSIFRLFTRSFNLNLDPQVSEQSQVPAFVVSILMLNAALGSKLEKH